MLRSPATERRTSKTVGPGPQFNVLRGPARSGRARQPPPAQPTGAAHRIGILKPLRLGGEARSDRLRRILAIEPEMDEERSAAQRWGPRFCSETSHASTLAPEHKIGRAEDDAGEGARRRGDLPSGVVPGFQLDRVQQRSDGESDHEARREGGQDGDGHLRE
jgi:hypothetical protein